MRDNLEVIADTPPKRLREFSRYHPVHRVLLHLLRDPEAQTPRSSNVSLRAPRERILIQNASTFGLLQECPESRKVRVVNKGPVHRAHVDELLPLTGPFCIGVEEDLP